MNPTHKPSFNVERSRRSLLLTLVAAPFLRVQAKTAPELHGSIIGHGTHRYRVDKL